MTYSIVARDPATGEMGVAVQSHFFGVGRIVTWGEAGVGVVATQSFAEPSYGFLGLELMRKGTPAPDALRSLLAVDDGEARRQVAMLDADGRIGVHTGEMCIPAAGHRTAEHLSAQANLMERDTVWGAMVSAFEASTGDLPTRLLDAMDAAEAEGGDIRGKQSAAILVVGGTRSGKPWEDRMFDLRVDDHPEPLAEIRRLVEIKRAYDRIERAEQLTLAGDAEGAAREFSAATETLGDNPEGIFWKGVSLASAGQVAEARRALERAYAVDVRWAELVRRLPRAGLLPDDEELIEKLAPRTG